MKIGNYLLFIILPFLMISCHGGKNATTKNFSLRLDTKAKKIRLGDTLQFSINNKKKLEIDSVSYQIEGLENKNTTNSSSFQLLLNNVKLGKQKVRAIVYSNGKQDTVSKQLTIYSNIAPVLYGYRIINEYPHDKKAFTQGLEFYNGKLYESTGKKGASSLRITDAKTGEVLKKIDLAAQYFGEGITILNDKLYMLTWQAKLGFVYDPLSLEKIDSFRYGKSKEGWGLCNDGKSLYKSDGTESIWNLDPNTLIERGRIQVCTNNNMLKDINELEWVDGKIYANTWQQNRELALIINPANGAVEALINFAGLKEKLKQHEDLNVLNGIAYNPESKTLFVTGKYWDKIFEIALVKQ